MKTKGRRESRNVIDDRAHSNFSGDQRTREKRGWEHMMRSHKNPVRTSLGDSIEAVNRAAQRIKESRRKGNRIQKSK